MKMFNPICIEVFDVAKRLRGGADSAPLAKEKIFQDPPKMIQFRFNHFQMIRKCLENDFNEKFHHYTHNLRSG